MATTLAPTNPARIQSLARASAIIEVIASSDPDGVGLTEISRKTALNKTTTFNLLASLLTLRFVEQNQRTKRYRLGLRNIELGRIVQRRLHVPTLARPFLADLCRKTNETVNLALPDLFELIVVDSISGSQFLKATAYVGTRSMHHCTALGKAVLAQRDEAMRRTIYRSCGLPRFTPHTITDIATLEVQLPRIIAQGYALDIEENEVGVNCIGTTIFNGFGEVASAISITAPSGRLTVASLEGHAKGLIAAAAAITFALRGNSFGGD